MPEAVLIDAIRTPIGALGGSLASVRPDDLAALVLKTLVERTGVDPALVEEVYLGCANQAGEDNRNVARMAVLLAGFPVEVAGGHLEPPVRFGSGSGQPGGARHPPGRRRGLYRRRGGEHVARPLLAAQGRERLLLRQPDRLGHNTWLALSQPTDGGAVRHRVDGRDRREHLRGDRHLRARRRTPLPCAATSAPSRPSISGKFAEEIVPVPVPQKRRRAAAGDYRRAPSPRYDPGIAEAPQAVLPQGWHGHCRQFLRAERRRRGSPADERRQGARAGPASRWCASSPRLPPGCRRG